MGEIKPITGGACYLNSKMPVKAMTPSVKSSASAKCSNSNLALAIAGGVVATIVTKNPAMGFVAGAAVVGGLACSDDKNQNNTKKQRDTWMPYLLYLAKCHNPAAFDINYSNKLVNKIPLVSTDDSQKISAISTFSNAFYKRTGTQFTFDLDGNDGVGNYGGLYSQSSKSRSGLVSYELIQQGKVLYKTDFKNKYLIFKTIDGLYSDEFDGCDWEEAEYGNKNCRSRYTSLQPEGSNGALGFSVNGKRFDAVTIMWSGADGNACVPSSGSGTGKYPDSVTYASARKLIGGDLVVLDLDLINDDQIGSIKIHLSQIYGTRGYQIGKSKIQTEIYLINKQPRTPFTPGD